MTTTKISKWNCIYLVIIMILHFQDGHAQKFGKVPDDVIKQQVYPLDSTADACYLVKKAKAYFDITTTNIFLVIEHHQRIKIYNDQGERFGRFEIPLYRNGSDRERISGLKAITYNYENGKITESKLNKKDVYNEETTENWSQEKFALPDVRAGSVLELKYTFRTPYRFFIPRFNFQG